MRKRNCVNTLRTKWLYFKRCQTTWSLRFQRCSLSKYLKKTQKVSVIKNNSEKLEKVAKHILFDPLEVIKDGSYVYAKRKSYMLRVNKKEFTKCVKIASIRINASSNGSYNNDAEFLREC